MSARTHRNTRQPAGDVYMPALSRLPRSFAALCNRNRNFLTSGTITVIYYGSGTEIEGITKVLKDTI
jgi:hypothetical protein